MKDQTAYPLTWPTGWARARTPQRSRFGSYNRKPTVAAGRDLVLAELNRMGVRRCILSTNLPLRNDGLPYSNQREPDDTGVAIYFELDGKPCSLACDKWNTVGDNLWAIGKHIEALRGQDRWGVGTLKQAFQGYMALEERTGPSCWDVLGITPDATEVQIMTAWRDRAKTAHPDTGGNHDAMTELNRAKDIAMASRKS